MKRSRFTEEQIIYAIRQAESGTPIGDLCRQLGGECRHLLRQGVTFPQFRGHPVKPPPSSLRTRPGNHSRVWSDDAADYRTLRCTQRYPVWPRPVCRTDDDR